MNLHFSTPKIIGVCLILMTPLVSCGRQEINSDYRVISEFPRTIALPDGDTCFAFDSDYGLLELSYAGKYLIGTLRKRERQFVRCVHDGFHSPESWSFRYIRQGADRNDGPGILWAMEL